MGKKTLTIYLWRMDLGFLSIDFLLKLFHSLFDIPPKKDKYAVKIKLDSDNYQRFLVWIKPVSHFSHQKSPEPQKFMLLWHSWKEEKLLNRIREAQRLGDPSQATLWRSISHLKPVLRVAQPGFSVSKDGDSPAALGKKHHQKLYLV